MNSNKDHLPLGDVGALVDYERSRVPSQHARGWFSLSAVFLGICVGIPPMVLGSNLAAGMGFQKAFSAIIWSSLIAMPICVLASQVDEEPPFDWNDIEVCVRQSWSPNHLGDYRDRYVLLGGDEHGNFY